MSLKPWRSYQLHSDLPPSEVLRLLSVSTPACKRWPDMIGGAPYFCGNVDLATGSFYLQRNGYRRGRFLFPQMNGTVRRGARGSMIDVSVSPSVACWLLLVPPLLLLAFIPLGIVAWLFSSQMKLDELAMFIVIPIGGVMFTWFVWAPPIVITYLSLPRYRAELCTLLNRMSERTPEGGSVLEAPETTEQRTIRQELRKRFAQNAMRIVSVFFAVFGLMLFLVGTRGLLTGELQMKNKKQWVKMTGPEGVAASQALLALGTGLAFTSLVGWRVSRRDLKDRSWPLPDTILISIGAFLMLLGTILAFRSFGRIAPMSASLSGHVKSQPNSYRFSIHIYR